MKKNWKGQTAYKAFALLIACITGITTLLAAIMMIFSIGLRAEYGNQMIRSQNSCRNIWFPTMQPI